MAKNKMTTLALDDLDIAELESRIELAATTGAAVAWGCDDKCAVNCTSVCDSNTICSIDYFR